MKLITGSIILTLFCTQSCFSATVDVSVHGLTSRDGVLNVSIWKNVKGFPKKPEDALAQKVVPVAGSDMTVRFDALEQGSYAVLAYHDQNSNGKLDMGFMGPKEPYGLSNNYRSKIGPPDFESCAFNLSDKLQIISILVK